MVFKPYAYIQPMNKISANFHKDLNNAVSGVAHTKYNVASEMQKNEFTS